MSIAIYDKRGIPIERGDVVKVFHFIGARRKRHYMYKQCLGTEFLHPSHELPRMVFSHLNLVENLLDRDGPYTEALGQKLEHYEIVQSIKCDHEERPRLQERQP